MTDASRSQDLGRIFQRLEGISNDVQALRADFRVYVAENAAVAETVRQHTTKLDEFERLKNKGMLYIVLGWLAAGGMGGGAAHFAKKFLE